MTPGERTFTRRRIVAPIAAVAVFGAAWLALSFWDYLSSRHPSLMRFFLFDLIGLIFLSAGGWGVWHVIRERYIVSDAGLRHVSASGRELESIAWPEVQAFEFERRIRTKGETTDYFILTSPSCHIQLCSDVNDWEELKALILSRIPPGATVRLDARPHVAEVPAARS